MKTLLTRLNRASLWRREISVWGQPLLTPTADRLLYACLHRLGLMGRADRRFFGQTLRPGMTVVDIGANIGLYALLFAHLTGPQGHVYAFEPDPDLFAALDHARTRVLKDVATATVGVSDLRVFPLALGETPGRLRLRRSFFNSGDNRLAAPDAAATAQNAPTADAPEIAIARGDDLLAEVPAVDFIKIDVQGWELHALRGLTATINRSPNLQIYLEFWPQGLRAAGCEPAELFAFLTAHGLAVRRKRAGRWEHVDSLAVLEKDVPGHRYINLWAGKLLS